MLDPDLSSALIQTAKDNITYSIAALKYTYVIGINSYRGIKSFCNSRKQQKELPTDEFEELCKQYSKPLSTRKNFILRWSERALKFIGYPLIGKTGHDHPYKRIYKKQFQKKESKPKNEKSQKEKMSGLDHLLSRNPSCTIKGIEQLTHLN